VIATDCFRGQREIEGNTVAELMGREIGDCDGDWRRGWDGIAGSATADCEKSDEDKESENRNSKFETRNPRD